MALSQYGGLGGLLQPFLWESPSFRSQERQLNSGLNSSVANWQPRTDIRETSKDYRISVEVPGAKKEDVSVELDGNMLQLSGKVEQEKTEEGETLHRYERVFGSFSRTFTLPEDANCDAIKAEFNNGILSLKIDKKLQDDKAKSSRRIELG